MPLPAPKSLSWPHVLAALRECAGESVRIRDGRDVEAADDVRTRAAAVGTEFCLFSGTTAATRLALIERLETLAKSPDRRFMSAARARVNGSFLFIDSVYDETEDEVVWTTVNTRRPKLGFNASQAKAPHVVGRTKRIKVG